MNKFETLILAMILFGLVFAGSKTRDRFLADVIKKTKSKLSSMKK